MLRLRHFFRSLFDRTRVEQELDQELQYHLDRQIDEGLKSGLTPAEARYAAMRAMGAITQNKEACRDARGVNLLDDLSRDLQYTGRSLRRSPGFAALAVLIMALGVGANTAVFSVVNAVLLKPLSYRDPDRIVACQSAKRPIPQRLRSRSRFPTFAIGMIRVPPSRRWQTSVPGRSPSWRAPRRSMRAAPKSGRNSFASLRSSRS